jgi:hypothetical protein
VFGPDRNIWRSKEEQLECKLDQLWAEWAIIQVQVAIGLLQVSQEETAALAAGVTMGMGDQVKKETVAQRAFKAMPAGSSHRRLEPDLVSIGIIKRPKGLGCIFISGGIDGERGRGFCNRS